MLLAWLWDSSPILAEVFGITLRWYGLMFSIAFLVGNYLIYYMFRNKGLDTKPWNSLFLYIFVGILVGARLGQVFFYDPVYYFSNPIKILYINEGGLASHGAAIGFFIALFLFKRRYKATRGELLRYIDYAAILIVLGGSMVRIGNFMNSEIYGQPTSSPTSVVFLRNFVNNLNTQLYPDKIRFRHDNPTDSLPQPSYVPIVGTLYYNSTTLDTALLRQKVKVSLPRAVIGSLNYVTPITATPVIRQQGSHTLVEFSLYGIGRHPAQLYESLSYIGIFLLMWFLWRYDKLFLGQPIALFCILVWTARFLIEFIKLPSGSLNVLGLHTGQWLSIPFIMIGIIIWRIQASRYGKPSLNGKLKTLQ